MKVYRDRGNIEALAAGLLVATGAALVIAGSRGTLWGVSVGATLAFVIGLLVLTRVRHTTTTSITGGGSSLSKHGVCPARPHPS